MKYEVVYTETYSNTYEIEADSYDDAEETFRDLMLNGKLDAPNNCIDSNISIF